MAELDRVERMARNRFTVPYQLVVALRYSCVLVNKMRGHHNLAEGRGTRAYAYTLPNDRIGLGIVVGRLPYEIRPGD